jgi:hypothetical protein
MIIKENRGGDKIMKTQQLKIREIELIFFFHLIFNLEGRKEKLVYVDVEVRHLLNRLFLNSNQKETKNKRLFMIHSVI